MAEVTCPSPFSASSVLNASTRVEIPAVNSPNTVAWNPLDTASGIVLSNLNLTLNSSAVTTGSSRAINSISSGKWYWEVKIDSEGDDPQEHYTGIATSSLPITTIVGRGSESYGLRGNGYIWHNNSRLSGPYAPAHSTGDTIGIALDLDNGKIWWAINNVWPGSGNPATGASPACTGVAGDFYPAFGASYYTSVAVTGRFCSGDLLYSPPSGFNAVQPPKIFDPFKTEGLLSVSEIYAGYVDLDEAFSTSASLNASIQQETPSVGAFLATTSGQAKTQLELSARAFQVVTGFSCDHCFNYAQISSSTPTPTCEMSAVFRYARIEAKAPTPTASFRVGKRIEGECPAPGFTCAAYVGRNPSIVASSPVPTCSMRVGLSLSDEATLFHKAGVPMPTCSMVADTHHLATLFGNVSVPTCIMVANTENVATISASVPCPRGLFTTTIGNVADIYGRVPIPICSMRAIPGIVVSLRGSVPVPGPLVCFYASLMNVSITLEGDVPVPTMTSSVLCSMPSSVLRYERGEVR